MPNILMTGTGPVEAPGIPTRGWFAVSIIWTCYVGFQYPVILGRASGKCSWVLLSNFLRTNRVTVEFNKL